jgi:hypothetical protein
MILLANSLFSRLNGKIPLMLLNAGAIIQTVSRIILAQAAGIRKRAPASQWEMQR